MKSSDNDNKSLSFTQSPVLIKTEPKITALEKGFQSISSSLSHSPKSNGSPASHTEPDDMPSCENDLALSVENDPEKPASSSMTYSTLDAPLSNGDLQLTSFEVKFNEDDPRNPQNWPLWYRSLIVLSATFGSISVVMHCTSYSISIQGMMKEFGLKDKTLPTYGFTSFLAGIALGSFLLAPLSEIYGRRLMYFVCMILYCLLVLPCAMATSLQMVLVARFFSAFAGSVLVSNTPGTIFDIFNEKYRPLALSIWSLAPLNGPVIGPLSGGFIVENLGWRWNNWVVMIISGISWLGLSLIKETYAPVILRKEVARLKKETGDNRWWSCYDMNPNVFEKIKVNLSRPFVLMATETILIILNIYVAMVYGILYVCFVSYPYVFIEVRGWSTSVSGLAFLGIGVGTIVAILGEPFLRRIINFHKKDPKTGNMPLECSLSIICIASVLCPLGKFWFSWTALPTRSHWIWPIIAGIPFGSSICLVMVYTSSYIAGVYGIFAASALSGNIVLRNLSAGLLPLLGRILYDKIGIQWGGTIMGIIMVALIPMPFAMYMWGHKVRARSRILKKMQAEEDDREKRMLRPEVDDRENKMLRSVASRKIAESDDFRDEEERM